MRPPGAVTAGGPAFGVLGPQQHCQRGAKTDVRKDPLLEGEQPFRFNRDNYGRGTSAGDTAMRSSADAAS